MSHDLRDLSGTTYERTRLRDATFTWIDLSGARVDHAGLRDVRMRGVELEDVEIDGELANVVINGVDVAPLIEAELDRRDPDYAQMKPTDADGSARRGTSSNGRWAETVDRARGLDPELLHERVDGEWSFIETLRHLCYATDAWVNRVYLGDPDPWDPLDLPFDTLRDLGGAHDSDVRPTLDEVLALRADRQATVRRVARRPDRRRPGRAHDSGGGRGLAAVRQLPGRRGLRDRGQRGVAPPAVRRARPRRPRSHAPAVQVVRRSPASTALVARSARPGSRSASIGAPTTRATTSSTSPARITVVGPSSRTSSTTPTTGARRPERRCPARSSAARPSPACRPPRSTARLLPPPVGSRSPVPWPRPGRRTPSYTQRGPSTECSDVPTRNVVGARRAGRRGR